jgi:hypothetical protein
LPNCIGSRDGKHVHTKCFPKTGSLYYNYRGYFLVILLACEDANALFTTVHVGDFGKNSDDLYLQRDAGKRIIAPPISNFPTTG